LIYDRTWLVKYDENLLWKWYEPLHEYVAPIDGKPIQVAKLVGGIMQATRDGARSKDPVKYLRDAIVFEKHHKSAEEKKEEIGSRSIFYLAQCYRDSGRPHLFHVAEKLYMERATKGGWPEEVYMSIVQAGICRILRNKYDMKVLELFMKAFELRPIRLEAPFWIVKWFRDHKMFKMGYTFGKPLINTPYPVHDKLFVDGPIHDWKFRNEVAICAYYAGDKELAKAINLKLLERTDLGPDRAQIEKNLGFCQGNTPDEPINISMPITSFDKIKMEVKTTQ